MRILAIGMMLCVGLIAGTVTAQAGKNTSALNTNLAKPDEIAALPGIDQEQAAMLVAARPLSGSGAMHAALGDGIDEARTAELLTKLFVPLNLNTASRAGTLRVPGVNQRVAHEFEEYRPCTSMEQFRREIGKYIDAAEVARLDQYVFVPMNLNTAPSETLATVPGMSRRMVREFEKYQPYSSITQFRREIGKYVDDKEVAWLERYVELP
jgi:DNA uptake protein ComE-like DNA-binding protein